MTDTCQNQLAKYPNSTLCSKEVSPAARQWTDWLTASWSSSVCPDACFRSTEEKRKLTASAGQRWNREDPRSKWFQQPLGASPQTPLLGTGSHEQRLLTATLVRPHGGDVAPENPGSQMSREPHGRSQKPDRKWGFRACHSKADKEAELVERKVCFISKAGNLRVVGWRADFCPKASSPWLTITGQEHFYQWREETSQSALTVFLKLVTGWSDQCHLNCFKWS